MDTIATPSSPNQSTPIPPFGTWLHDERTAANLSQAELAIHTHLSNSSISVYELGKAIPKQAHIDTLTSHKVSQNAERLKLGPVWEDADFVFANELGRGIEAGNVLRRSFWPLLEKAGLPRIRFHDLRHTAATLMLGNGAHPKIASEMLGHSKNSITLDLCSHVNPTMQQQATDALEAVLHG